MAREGRACDSGGWMERRKASTEPGAALTALAALAGLASAASTSLLRRSLAPDSAFALAFGGDGVSASRFLLPCTVGCAGSTMMRDSF